MTRIFIYLLLFGTVLYVLSLFGRAQKGAPQGAQDGIKPGRWFRPKKNPRENWFQVYETSSLDEARMLQARLQELEVECIVYEQGKKDIHGNKLPGIGIVVPKTAVPRAQNVITRMSI